MIYRHTVSLSAVIKTGYLKALPIFFGIAARCNYDTGTRTFIPVDINIRKSFINNGFNNIYKRSF